MKAASLSLSGLLLLFSLAFLQACKSPPATSPKAEKNESPPPRRPRQAIREEIPVRAAEPRAWDLLHTSLDVGFDWEKQRLQGTATLLLSPIFYTQDSIVLDAKGFEIDSMSVDGFAIKFEYDLRKIVVHLPHDYKRRDTLEIRMQYTARPYELEELGLHAEADDHGLYFINADGALPHYPQQIWTQGQTQANSCWFPTLDQPNERCTQEMFIRVQDRFKTLSNGVLVDSEQLENGYRRDHWVMRQPHAPYLFMMAIGEFAVVKDEWRGKEVSYWVEPEYEPYADLVFGNTPEMLEFFSELFGVEYPYEKYAQVVVREFVSGAMENTSATIHFDALQHDDRRHLDATMETFVSHELTHQWFGDMVTCESWSHLTLNEAFATYGEFLWIEHAHGIDDAARQLLSDRQSYFYEANRRAHPLIHFRYRNRDGMFDSHSYQKGGQVLHMLRHEVGDEAFFASLKLYLERNAFTDVEADELRLAFEDVTGLDLRWFFDQWFFEAGHPQLRVVHERKPGVYRLHVTQLQDSVSQPIFQFPVTVAAVRGDDREEKRFWVASKDTTLEFRSAFPPDMVDFNSDGVLLAEVQEEKPREMWLRQFGLSENYHERRAALLALEGWTLEGDTLEVLRSALQDKYWGIQMLALRWADGNAKREVQEAVLELLSSSKAAVRSRSVNYFRDLDIDLEADMREAVLAKLKTTTDDRSYNVQQNSLLLMGKLDPDLAKAKARELAPDAKGPIPAVIAMIFARTGDPMALDFIGSRLKTSKEPGERVGFIRALGEMWDKHSSTDGQPLLMQLAESDPVWWVRLTAGRTLSRMDENTDLKAFYEKMAGQEEVGMVKDFWKNLVE